MTLDDVMDKHWDCLNRVGVERHARDEMLRAAILAFAAEQVAAERERLIKLLPPEDAELPSWKEAAEAWPKRAEQMVAEYKQDAERYRWLKSVTIKGSEYSDAQIDAILRAREYVYTQEDMDAADQRAEKRYKGIQECVERGDAILRAMGET